MFIFSLWGLTPVLPTTVQQKAYVAELYFGLECYIKLETINGNLNFNIWIRAIFMISLENFKDAFIYFIRIS